MAGAYGAFTVSKEAVPEVKTYIRHQKERHATGDLVTAWEEAVTAEGQQSA